MAAAFLGFIYLRKGEYIQNVTRSNMVQLHMNQAIPTQRFGPVLTRTYDELYAERKHEFSLRKKNPQARSTLRLEFSTLIKALEPRPE